MSDTLYVTTTIPYVNARPHIGFALELVQADALARYHRLRGDRVRFQTGTDDNASSNVLSAAAQGVPVEELVRRNSAAFEELAGALHLSHDLFIRTASAAHHRAVHDFLGRLVPGDVYQGTYCGLYCPRCEDFLLEREAAGSRCPEHGAPLEVVEETNHFFRLCAYQEQVGELIESGRIQVQPDFRRREILAFIERGLRDFSISRPSERSDGWGVPFPGRPEQTVYVWVDALVNYLTGLGFPDPDGLAPFWSPDSRAVHVIGKNVWKFHAVYWPALLLSAGLEVPDRILAHGFVTENGRKISKSSGTAADPIEYVEAFGADAVRYYLLAHCHPFQDTDFSLERLAEVYRTDLANNLGNLTSRLTALAEKAGVQGVSPSGSAPRAPDGWHEHWREGRFDLAAGALRAELDTLNREIAEARPWEGLDATSIQKTRRRLSQWLERLRAVAHWLQPFLPSTSTRIRQALERPEIIKVSPLFPRRG